MAYLLFSKILRLPLIWYGVHKLHCDVWSFPLLIFAWLGACWHCPVSYFWFCELISSLTIVCITEKPLLFHVQACRTKAEYEEHGASICRSNPVFKGMYWWKKRNKKKKKKLLQIISWDAFTSLMHVFVISQADIFLVLCASHAVRRCKIQLINFISRKRWFYFLNELSWI